MSVTDTNKPSFTNSEIADILRANYQLSGELNTLPSYCDFNLLLQSSDNSSYIIKVTSDVASNSANNLTNLEMQNSAMNHLHRASIPVPLALNNCHAEDISLISDADGKSYYLRVLTFLEGSFYADTPSDTHEEPLWLSLGHFMGKLDKQLASFSHPGAYTYLEWDLAQGFAICQSKKHLLNELQAPLVESFLNSYQIDVMPLLSKLPQGIIHNDANDYNLLVNHPKRPQSITGIIDFGDMVYSHLINELAITCAYAIMNQNAPLQVIKQIVKGYHQHRPLEEVEIDVLMNLIALRLCTTLCNAALAIKEQPDNEYLLVSVQPAIDALIQLQSLNFFAAKLQLLQVCGLTDASLKSPQEIINFRQEHLGRTLSLSYQKPLKIISGRGVYLYDDMGVAYLDMVNNVCHVGHCQPEVVAAGQQQMARLNTNTRYLHDNIVEFSEKLLATFPDELSVCMFVNSGSEANELAFRLAQCYSGSKELIVVDGAYHGNTAACIKASPYKFDGPGGTGAEANIHKVTLPDPYRGQYSGYSQRTGATYATDIDRAIDEIQARGNTLGAYICESLQGVAGQIIMPEGYLQSAYQKVRAAGGVCIADEVQVGFGRVGTHMWAFETQNVIPDIVTLGKPIGNGHPLAAVVMRKEVADAFITGMEYFNTFGGNPVSCAIGSAVLDVIKNQELQKNALNSGRYFMEKLIQLQNEFELIGDVRGLGLFIGVELVEDRTSKKPATDKMNWLIEFFKRHAILMSSEGPFYNVLKIKPPIVFNQDNVDEFILVLRKGLEQLSRDQVCGKP